MITDQIKKEQFVCTFISLDDDGKLDGKLGLLMWSVTTKRNGVITTIGTIQYQEEADGYCFEPSRLGLAFGKVFLKDMTSAIGEIERRIALVTTTKGKRK